LLTGPFTVNVAFLAAATHSLVMPIMNVPSELAQPAEPGMLHLLLSCVTVHVYSLNKPL
jgi:hypothetical protein